MEYSISYIRYASIKLIWKRHSRDVPSDAVFTPHILNGVDLPFLVVAITGFFQRIALVLTPQAADDGSYAQHHKEGGNGTAEKNVQTSVRQHQRLGERGFHHLREHDGQDERSHGETELAHEVTDDAKNEGHPHIEQLETDAVGSDHREDQN